MTNFEKWKLDLVSKHFKLADGDYMIDDEFVDSSGARARQNNSFEANSDDDGKVVSEIVKDVEYIDKDVDDNFEIIFEDSCPEAELGPLLREYEETSKDVNCESGEDEQEEIITMSDKVDLTQDSFTSDAFSEQFDYQDIRLRQDKKIVNEKSENFGKTGRNCASFILIWGKEEFYKTLGGSRGKGKILIQKLVNSVCKCLGSLASALKFECQSTVGNQVRKDFVFSHSEQAKEFVEKVKATVTIPNNVALKPFLMSEEYLGLGLEPELSEQDLLVLAKDMQAVHLFRHFLDCRILSEGEETIFRFNSLSDINLFLFNKANTFKKSLGRLKSCPRQDLQLQADKDGILTLETKDLSIGGKDWTDLESRFMFKTRRKKGIKYLLFKNKKDMFNYYVSREAKELTSLVITQAQIVRVKPQKKIEPLISGCKERQLKVASQLAGKLRELKSVNAKVLKREKDLKAQKRIIQKLNQKLKSVPDCISNTLRLQDILRLEFKEESESSCNYLLCLRNFLQSEALLRVDEEDGEIIFTFSSSTKLEKLLTTQCCKTVKKWSEISKLSQRAGIVSEKLHKNYGLLVYLEEISLINKTIEQVKDELESCQAKIEYRNFGFAARFPTLLSFMQAMVNRELYSHHRVMFMQENVLFMGRSESVKFFNGQVCLLEEDWLRLQWKTREEESCVTNGSCSLESFVGGLSAFIRDARVKDVCEDWDSQVVLCFESKQILESVLRDHCDIASNSLAKLGRLPVNFSLTGSEHCYSVGCPPDVDARHFFMLDNSCSISQDSTQISSASRIFPFLCLNNVELRTTYASLCLQISNFNQL